MESRCRRIPGFAGRMMRLMVLVFLAFPLITMTAFAEDPPVFFLKWGSLGDGNGQFYGPFGIAVDPLGNVYVTDTGNNRIQKFDASGAYRTQWGSYGSGDGQFYRPMGIAVDSLCNVYVVDSNNNRIQKFDPSGEYITQWGAYGTDVGQFKEPVGVAVDSEGNVYVTELYNRRIQKFNSNGIPLTQWMPTTNNYGLRPFGITVDPAGNVYVTENGYTDKYDHAYRFEKFSSSGEPLAIWGSVIVGPIPPFGVAVDSLGNVYVVDYFGTNRIKKFDSSGILLTQWGAYGSDDGQFIGGLNGIAVDSWGNVYVVDSNNQIQKFVRPGWTPTGDFVPVYPIDQNPVVPGTSVIVNFSEVTSSGITTVTSSESGTQPPTGFSLGNPPVYFDITTTATLSPDCLITVCIKYTGTVFDNESRLRLYHQAPGGELENITTSLDTINDIICGVSSSLSPFVPLEASFQFVGFFDPVQTGPGVVNLAYAGKAIPLKWKLIDKYGAFISDLSAVTGTRYQQTECSGNAWFNDIDEALGSGNSGLHYDFTSNQYVYSWKTTKNMSGNCYRLNVEFFNFEVHSALFQMW